MRVITPGHKYELDNFEGDKKKYLQFIQKDPLTTSPEDDNYKDLITIENGTTTEEVLKVIVDRFAYLNKQFPSRKNSIILTKLEESLMWIKN